MSTTTSAQKLPLSDASKVSKYSDTPKETQYPESNTITMGTKQLLHGIMQALENMPEEEKLECAEKETTYKIKVKSRADKDQEPKTVDVLVTLTPKTEDTEEQKGEPKTVNVLLTMKKPKSPKYTEGKAGEEGKEEKPEMVNVLFTIKPKPSKLRG